MKLTEAQDLEKAGHSIGNFFAKQVEDLEKTHNFHKAMAGHHGAAGAQHTALAAHNKGMAEGLGKDHELHAHFHKISEHHTALAAHQNDMSGQHAAEAEKCKAQVDAMKVISAEWGGTPAAKAAAAPGSPVDLSKANTITEKFQTVTDALVTKALEQVSTSSAVGEVLEKFALEQINKLIGEKIGDKLVPSAISAVAPTRPGIRQVPRAGEQPVSTKPAVPLEFAKLVDTEDDEENARIG
jgi:hypothetical protein